MVTPSQVLTQLKKLELGYRERLAKQMATPTDYTEIRKTEESIAVIEFLTKREKYLKHLGGFEHVLTLAKRSANNHCDLF